jgi:hypothetical protein
VRIDLDEELEEVYLIIIIINISYLLLVVSNLREVEAEENSVSRIRH